MIEMNELAGKRSGTYSILTWGCQMNEDDSAQMASMMETEGYVPVHSDVADVILLNTCSVRAKPEQKVYTMLGRLRERKMANPEMIIGVCGCMAQKEAPQIRLRAPYVDLVIGTGQIDRLPMLVQSIKDERKPRVETDLPSRRDRDDRAMPKRVVGGLRPKLKSFVSIMYGCDKFCHFCIVPITRGKERSREASEIVDEVERLASLGTREITLLGQTVNSYGKFLDTPCSFAQLLTRLSKIDGIERIRYTSPYPKDFNDDLIESISSLPKVMHHVHMPIQVGDNDLLQRMHRGYTLDQYQVIVNKLRAAVPDLCLTTDLMLGYPGETEDEFQNTMDWVRMTRYDSAYMFAYSPREGTKAAELPDQIPHPEKIRRLEALIAVQNDITLQINRDNIGNTFNVLVEGRSSKDKDKWTGLTEHGKTMNFTSNSIDNLFGEIVPVQAVSAHLWGFAGEHTAPKQRSFERLNQLDVAII